MHLAESGSGSYNTALGSGAGGDTSSGSSNICLGYNAGGTIGVSNQLVIGAGTGTSNGYLSTAYINGIAGATLSAGSPTPYLVLCDSSDSQIVSPTPVAANTASSTFGSLAVGTAKQNTANYPIMVTISMAITAATGAVILVGIGSTSTPTAQALTASFSTTGTMNFSFPVPAGYYAKSYDNWNNNSWKHYNICSSNRIILMERKKFAMNLPNPNHRKKL